MIRIFKFFKNFSYKTSYKASNAKMTPTSPFESAIKVDRSYNYDNSNDNNKLQIHKENLIQTQIIEHPDIQIAITEEEIHSAMKQTGKLPELDLKEIMEDYAANNIMNDELKFHIEKSVLSKLNLCLNKSLIEICKVGKKNIMFKEYNLFWESLQTEILSRQDTMSNDQLADVVSSFAKSNVNIFTDLEETLTDSYLPFTPDNIEKIFFAYCDKKQGSTTFLKYFTKKYLKYKDALNVVKMSRFITELNNHPQTIPSNFGVMVEFEEMVTKEIDFKTIKFDELITLAINLFGNNLCTNKTQHLLEVAIIEKFENKVHIDISRIIKLVKSLSDYYIKNVSFCLKIKNYLETYLNGLIKQEQENSGDNLNEVNRNNNINLEFTQQYSKLVSSLNILIWSFSRNNMFLKLKTEGKNATEFEYFYSRLKDTFFKHIDYYNEREIAFTLNGIVKLLTQNSNIYNFTHEENKIISNKINKLDNFLPNDAIKLLKLFNQLNYKSGTINKLTNVLITNYETLTLHELIEFMDLFQNNKIQFHKLFIDDLSKLKFFEKRLLEILPKIEIQNLCRVLKICCKSLLCSNISQEFLSNLQKTLLVRINEIPKENFIEVFSNSVNLKLNQIVLNLIDILEDLSNFENMKEFFKNPREVIPLLWCCLSVNNSSLKLTQLQRNFIDKFLNIYLSDNFLEDFMNKTMNIDQFIENEKMFKNDEFLLHQYIQTVFLAYDYYIKNSNNSAVKVSLEELNYTTSSYMYKIDLDTRTNLLNSDPASKCSPKIIESLHKELLTFFTLKSNTSIYPNLIDEFLNFINIAVYFEKEDEETIVYGLDSKKFAVIIYNKYYFTNNNILNTVYENRINILKQIHNWEIIEIEENIWNETEDKQLFLKNKFGFDLKNYKFQEQDNKSHKLEKQGKTPKYYLTKKLLNK